MSKTLIPPYLKKGDLIGITCPSGHMDAKNVNACVQTLRLHGYDILVGHTVSYPSNNYFSAPDEVKIAELQAMLDAPEIKAILFGRGGYGMSRIIDALDFSRFKKSPKWLIGFSDITVILNHVYAKYHIASLHGPMCSAFKNKKTANNVLSLLDALKGKTTSISYKSSSLNRIGQAEGIVVGGNLSLMTNTIGSVSEIDTKNKILFLEDVGEYLYSIDRMLQQLKRAGKLDHLKALIVGGFTELKDTERPFGKQVEGIIADIVADYDYPVCFHFPVSHGNENLTLKIGATHHLSVKKSKVMLKELC